MRFVSIILLTLFLAAESSAQQRTHEDGVLTTVWVANAFASGELYGADLDGSRGFEEDTTSAWRYFPLHVGDAWEYKFFFENKYYRREVVGDTLIEGKVYADYRYFVAENGGPMTPDDFVPRKFLRFDTLSAFVYERISTGERITFDIPCPFDADFGTMVFCPGTGATVDVMGGYDGVLVFGGEEPGTGEDTVYTAVKEYQDFALFRYGADYGEVYLLSDAQFYGLYYSRVGRVEHGIPRYPTVNNDPSIPEVVKDDAPSLWPNPTDRVLWVEVSLHVPQKLVVCVFDVAGRRVQETDGGLRQAGHSSLSLLVSSLNPGTYILRVLGDRGYRGTALFTKLK